MTRINVVPVEELSNKHLLGENHEITRVYNLARKVQHEVIRGSKKLPLHYTLGTGHVLFFYNKLGFISKRYAELTEELRRRVTHQIRFLWRSWKKVLTKGCSSTILRHKML